jgi:hypothetical protein
VEALVQGVQIVVEMVDAEVVEALVQEERPVHPAEEPVVKEAMVQVEEMWRVLHNLEVVEVRVEMRLYLLLMVRVQLEVLEFLIIILAFWVGAEVVLEQLSRMDLLDQVEKEVVEMVVLGPVETE